VTQENTDLRSYIEKLEKAQSDVKTTADKSQQIVDQHK
ncbi:MAG: DNA-directed RNA polymerase subunit omega, partial [Enterococcus sp.]